MLKRNIFSFLCAVLISVTLVYQITDMYNIEMNIYNFSVFMFLFIMGTLGLSSSILIINWIKKIKLKKDLILKTTFKTSIVMNLFLIGIGIIFYDGSLPKEFEGDEYIYNYSKPVDYKDGIDVDEISDSILIRDTIKNVLERIVENRHFHGMNSFLLWNKGRLIVEEYFYEFNKDKRQDIRSISKSITSLLTGIAIEKGFIKSIDDKVATYFPEYFKNYDVKSEKHQITIRDLLNMNSCLDCNDWDKESPGKEEKIYKTEDWIKTVLDLGVIKKDTVFGRYCTGGVNVIGEIIARASNMKLDEFAEKNLFNPLGITNYNYRYTPKNRVDAGGHMYMTSRDLLKIGMLVLNNGIWNGRQIVSVDWIYSIYCDNIKMLEPQLLYPGYGMLWWKIDLGFDIKGIQALGNGGQMIFVFPELDTVIVFTGSNYNNYRMMSPFKLMKESILPALI